MRKTFSATFLALLLAATGPLPGLETLFDALLRQTLRAARLIVAVESREDPAHDRVKALAQGHPALPTELIIAGLSGERRKNEGWLGGTHSAWFRGDRGNTAFPERLFCFHCRRAPSRVFERIS